MELRFRVLNCVFRDAPRTAGLCPGKFMCPGRSKNFPSAAPMGSTISWSTCTIYVDLIATIASITVYDMFAHRQPPQSAFCSDLVDHSHLTRSIHCTDRRAVLQQFAVAIHACMMVNNSRTRAMGYSTFVLEPSGLLREGLCTITAAIISKKIAL